MIPDDYKEILKFIAHRHGITVDELIKGCGSTEEVVAWIQHFEEQYRIEKGLKA